MAPLLDPSHPFFAQPWRRWATTAAPLAWAGLELWQGNPGWALIFGAFGGYAAWALILNRQKG